VIEGCGLPSRSVVTNLASLRKSAGDMVGIRGPLEVLQMARHAGIGSQVVIVIDVAISASSRRHSMLAVERKPGAVVVELRVRPVAGVVALLAGLREVRSNVIRIGRALEVVQVAGHASCAGQVVVIVDVAVGAGTWRHGVQAREREPRAVVVELRVRPVAGIVALLAGLREV